MSDDESPGFKDGDIVWVKLGTCWWPGEVTENRPEDYVATKPPIAIVKFFNEDSYEFVKNENQIYEYNCKRKHEFIKKGMDGYRGYNSHMKKFPGDVSYAEIRTNGNPNIVNDPEFAPEQKSSLLDVFGSPGAKKGRISKNVSPRKDKNKPIITHRRFLGYNDYKADFRIQYPGKDMASDFVDEDIKNLNRDPTDMINCSLCPFKTLRLEVMVFHTQYHIKGVKAPLEVSKKVSPKKKLIKTIKHITSDNDNLKNSSERDEEVEPKAKQQRVKK